MQQKSKSFERSELMVRRLIRLTVETGCACALSAVLELAFFLGMPETNIHLIVYVSPLESCLPLNRFPLLPLHFLRLLWSLFLPPCASH